MQSRVSASVASVTEEEAQMFLADVCPGDISVLEIRTESGPAVWSNTVDCDGVTVYESFGCRRYPMETSRALVAITDIGERLNAGDIDQPTADREMATLEIEYANVCPVLQGAIITEVPDFTTADWQYYIDNICPGDISLASA